MSFFDDANAEYDAGPGAGVIAPGPYATPTMPRAGDPNVPPPPTGPTGPTPDAGDWITQALASAGSTDDPGYWRGVIGKDPKVAAGDPSAIDYWKMRISIGDGAAGVRNGTLQTYAHGPSLAQLGQQGQQGPRPPMGAGSFRPMPSMQQMQQQGPPMQQGPGYQPVPMQAPNPMTLAQLGKPPINYRIAGKP